MTSPYSCARADWIVANARRYGQRTGQLLFNKLPHDVANVVRGTLFDPFQKELVRQQVINWFDNHVVFSDEGEIILVFDNNNVLWEKE